MKIMSDTGSGQKKIEKNFVVNFSITPVVTLGRSEDNHDSSYSYCWLEKFTDYRYTRTLTHVLISILLL